MSVENSAEQPITMRESLTRRQFIGKTAENIGTLIMIGGMADLLRTQIQLIVAAGRAAVPYPSLTTKQVNQAKSIVDSFNTDVQEKTSQSELIGASSINIEIPSQVKTSQQILDEQKTNENVRSNVRGSAPMPETLIAAGVAALGGVIFTVGSNIAYNSSSTRNLQTFPKPTQGI